MSQAKPTSCEGSIPSCRVSQLSAAVAQLVRGGAFGCLDGYVSGYRSRLSKAQKAQSSPNAFAVNAGSIPARFFWLRDQLEAVVQRKNGRHEIQQRVKCKRWAGRKKAQPFGLVRRIRGLAF